MTDNEKASEYTRENIDLATSMYNPNAEEIAFRACLYGLAEGRKEKWHDLRKDPNDLPKDEEVLKEYLVAYQNFNNPNEIVVGSFTWNGVRFLENYDYSEIPYFENKNVLFAWCELPKFEE